MEQKKDKMYQLYRKEMYLYIADVLSMDYEMWSAHYSIKIQFQTSCLNLQFPKSEGL